MIKSYNKYQYIKAELDVSKLCSFSCTIDVRIINTGSRYRGGGGERERDRTSETHNCLTIETHNVVRHTM